MNTKIMSRAITFPIFTLLTSLFFLSIYFYNPQPLLADGPTQTYYVPLPEAEIFSAFTSLTTFSDGTTCTESPSDEPMTTYLSIVPVANDGIIYYDHWEDGFDADIMNPATRSTTEIWGDGDLSNGFLSTYPSDTFRAGQVIVLTSTVNTAITGTLGFDGGDKVATNKAMAMSRTSWAAQTVTKLAGAVEMYDTRHWGMSYHIPIGEDIPSGANQPAPFEYTGLSVMAGQDNTQVYFNSVLTATLAEGESYFIDGSIQVNDVVTATAPVQVNLITGDLCAAYESRWYALFSDAHLSDSYYTPVGTLTTTAPAEVYLYNPDSLSIVIRQTLVDGSTDLITVPGGQTVLTFMPDNQPNSGASFVSTDGSPFNAFSNVWGPSYDWGFTLIPEGLLTPGVTVGLGIGQDPTSMPITPTNGSPIWVTPIIPPGGPPTATLVIDYEHDGSRVERVDLQHLESYRVFDSVDHDQTGLALYVDSPFLSSSSYIKLAAVWGQDPISSTADSPGLDMGTALVPAPLFVGKIQSELGTDSDGNGELNPGDTLTYTIVLENVSVLPISDITITDTLPLHTTYIPDSARLMTGNITSTITDIIGSTPFPLDEGGFTIATLLGNETLTATFAVTVNVVPEGSTQLDHVPHIRFLDQTLTLNDSTQITATPNFEITVLVDGENAADNLYIIADEPILWTYIVTNTGHVPLTLTHGISGVVPTLVGGDDNGDMIFDPGETWVYSATVTAPSTAPNGSSVISNTIRGERGNTQITQTLSSTFFAADLTLEVDKIASTYTITTTTDITYTYLITNSGNVTITPFVTDDRCMPLTLMNNTRSDTVLSANETWRYQCSMPVSTDLTNTVTVTGTVPLTLPADLTVTPITDTAFVDRLPTILLQKTVTPTLRAEPGGLFTYTLTLTNTTPETVTLTIFTDTHPLSSACRQVWVGSQLAAGATISCVYSATHSTAGTYTNTLSVMAQDDESNGTTATDQAIAEVGDEPPVINLTKRVMPTSVMEPGGIFTYTLSLTNLAIEPVTVLTLTDSYTLSAECQALIGRMLAAGESLSCGYQVTHTGISSYTNQAQVAVADDEGSRGFDSAETIAHVLDELPSVTLTKMVTPTIRSEPGGVFTYTLLITNTSIGETINLIELRDTFPVSAECRALVGTTLAPGLATSCSYTVTHIGAGVHENNATVVVTDDEGNRIEEDNRDDEIPPAEVVSSVIVIEKSPATDQVPEPGVMITFTVAVTNTGAKSMTLIALIDNVAGNLNGRGSCIMGQVLLSGEHYRCTYKEFVGGVAGTEQVSKITATVQDEDNDFFQASRGATVTVYDALPEILVTKIADPAWLPEPGGVVTFTVSVENRSTEIITITTLIDSIYGDLNGQGSCAVPQVLPIGQTYRCGWDIDFAGDPGFSEENIVTATAQDRAGNIAGDEDDATVLIIDVGSMLEVTQSASQMQATEAGEPVTFHLVISNTSPADTVVIDAILDSVYGDLADPNNSTLIDSDCIIGEMLAVGESTECVFTALVSGQPGAIQTNRTTVIGTDNDGATVIDDGSLSIDITDVPPTVALFKVPRVESVPPPGANVTFAITIANQSLVDDIVVTALNDSAFGDLTTLVSSTCQLPQSLAVETSYHCEFVGFIGGSDGDVHTNRVTAAIRDDDGIDLEVSGSAVVPILGVTEIAIQQQPSEDRVPESGDVITFTVAVSNTGSSGSVTLTTLNDSIYGDLTLLSSSNCTLPQELAMGTEYRCQFTGLVTGSPGDVHGNVITASAAGRADETVQAEATAAIDIYDLLSAISVHRSASPNQVPEEGGIVDFEVTVQNDSLVDVVTLETLESNVYGDLSAYENSDCQVPQMLLPAISYTCTFTIFVNGGANTLYQDVVVASALDDDGRVASAQGGVLIEIVDTPAEIRVQKGSDQTIVIEGGETVRFIVEVQNVSVSDVVTLTSMIDSVYGDLIAHSDSTCTLPQVLTPNQQYICEFSAFVSLAADGGNTHVNTVRVAAQDDDRRVIEAADDHSILIASPKISARKTDNHVDMGNNSLVNPGDIIDYTIILENRGTLTATGVTVEDVLGSHSTFGGLLISSQGTIQQNDARSVLIEVGEIAPSQLVTISLGTALAGASTNASQLACIENQANVFGRNFLPVVTDDPGSATPQDPTQTGCDPTAITLSYFAPIWEKDGVHVHWLTGSEFNTWGFNILRGVSDTVEEAVKVTPSSVSANAPNGLYRFVDTEADPDIESYYWLEERDNDGKITAYGPFLLEPDSEIRVIENAPVKKNFLPVVWR